MIFLLIGIVVVLYILGRKSVIKSRYKIANGKINMIFGLRGCGKSTHAAYVVSRCNKFNVAVFSNFPIHGAYQLGDICEADYPVGSVLIIDEAGLAWGNRDFKSMPKEVIEFFKMSRHHEYTIYLYSQAYNDCDKKIRDLTDNMIYCSKIGSFSRYIKMTQYIGVDEGGQPCTQYKPLKPLKFLFCHWLYRKRYYKLFDSYAYVPKEEGRAIIPW